MATASYRERVGMAPTHEAFTRAGAQAAEGRGERGRAIPSLAAAVVVSEGLRHSNAGEKRE